MRIIQEGEELLSRCLRTTSVGSLPKPAYLKRARGAHERGDMSADELETLTKKATREAIALQKDLGIDVLVDGEMYRGDMATYFAENLTGFEISGLVRSYGNRYYRKPICVSEVKFRAPITLERWKFAQGLTSKPLKAILTGPYTMMDWSFNEFYATRSEFARAVALALKLNAHFYTHICYGDFTRIYPKILELPVDQLDLEMTNSQMDMLKLFQKHKFTKEIGLGVVDSHSHVIEKKDEVKNRIRQTVELISPEKIYVDPDCGLKTRTWEEAREKLKVIVEAARELREELKLD
jgi:5-methyltetrahydropteroyltriglutamate--homocysteine methyltransferase